MKVKGPSTEEVSSIVSEQASEKYVRRKVDPTGTGLDELHGRLVDAAKAYAAGPQLQRQAVCDAIIATSGYLEREGFSDATLIPLNRVLWAIVELCEQNRPDPLFCEKPKAGKSRRSLEESTRQGHLAALADLWLEANSNGEGQNNAKLKTAARQIKGLYFGTVTPTMLESARSYQRQHGHSELLYDSYTQMKDALIKEAKEAGGGKEGLRTAIDVQIKALNKKAKLLQS